MELKFEIDWTTLKNTHINNKNLSYSHIDKELDRIVWVCDGTVTLYSFLQAETTDYTDFTNNYLAKSNKRATIKQDLDISSPLWMSSPNLADKTTWWYDSVRINNEALTDSGDGFTWIIAKPTESKIIDMVHGKMLREDDVAGGVHSLSSIDHGTKWDADGLHYLIPKVEVDSVLQTRVDSPSTSDEYSIDYVNGNITFYNNNATKDVRMWYHYGLSSLYEWIPATGKLFDLGLTELNCRNVSLGNEVVYFSIFVAGSTEYARRVYKTENDYIDASIGAPITWKEWWFVKFPYKGVESNNKDSSIKVKSSLGMKIQIKIIGNTEYQSDGGSTDPRAVITLHCTSEGE